MRANRSYEERRNLRMTERSAGRKLMGIEECQNKTTRVRYTAVLALTE